MAIQILGVDLGKSSIHVVAHDGGGRQLFKKRLTRAQFASLLGTIERCRVVFEACGGGHYWARQARELGHDAALIPAQFIKPFVKNNKNDFIDAEAICEAAARPGMRYVTVRDGEQQALGALVKARESFVRERTACINRTHGFLLEFGIALPKGKGLMRRALQQVSMDDNRLPGVMRELFHTLYRHHGYLEERIDQLEREIDAVLARYESAQRLRSIPGIGPVATCQILAWVGDGRQFKSGKQLAAWLGLVPREYSTGGKQKLLGISKRGNSALRTTLIHGARSVIQWRLDKGDAWSAWLKNLLAIKPKPVAIVAMANRLARVVWAVLVKEQSYQLQPAG